MINGGEWLILLFLGLLLLGPHKLPDYVRTLARWIKAARRLVAQAKEKVTDELGGDEVIRELADLNPAQLRPSVMLRGDQGDPMPAPGRAARQTAMHWDSEAT